MDLQKCCKCKQEKLKSEFHWRNKNKGTLQKRCKTCHCAYIKQWYIDNKEKVFAKVRRQTLVKQEKHKKIINELKNKPCMDCGVKYPHWIMDFDHRDPSSKSDNVSSMISRRSLKKIIEEINKCDVVCSNCHRQRTHERICAQVAERRGNKLKQLI